MAIIIIGSTALNLHIKSSRTPNDLDILGSYTECMDYIHNYPKNLISCYPIDKGKKILATYKLPKRVWRIEAEITWPDSTAALFYKTVLKNTEATPKHLFDTKIIIPSLNSLYALKLSHRYRKNSPHFHKTRNDIMLLREHRATLNGYEEFFKIREKETYNYGHPNLKTSKKDFFTDSIDYLYDHDDIHKAVAINPGVPQYLSYKQDKEEVYCSKELFDNLPHLEKCQGVLEEAYVLALERSLIPHPGVLTREKAFLTALEKICTSITSGWFREFAWENYDDVVALYNENYVDKFDKALNSGEIKNYEN